MSTHVIHTSIGKIRTVFEMHLMKVKSRDMDGRPVDFELLPDTALQGIKLTPGKAEIDLPNDGGKAFAVFLPASLTGGHSV